MNINELSNTIIGAAIEVHKILGPGLLESVYEECLGHELELRGLSFNAGRHHTNRQCPTRVGECFLLSAVSAESKN
jgi:GxxExxY protein